ncbi:MAG: hypothetical protein PHO66_08325, partial [Eubacteriales bacterium]|nr:hypothetical protein [Eubacteriales bacterium]
MHKIVKHFAFGPPRRTAGQKKVFSKDIGQKPSARQTEPHICNYASVRFFYALRRRMALWFAVRLKRRFAVISYLCAGKAKGAPGGYCSICLPMKLDTVLHTLASSSPICAP